MSISPVGSRGVKRGRGEDPCERPVKRQKASEIKLRQLLLKKKYIHFIRDGQKIVEGRLNKKPVSNYQVGERVRFYYFRDKFDDVVCDITDIKKFASFREMLEETGVKACIPDVEEDIEEAIKIYNSFPGYAQKVAEVGVVALYLQVNNAARQEYAHRAPNCSKNFC